MSGDLTPVEVIVNRILLVEGDRQEAEFLKSYLSQHRMDVEIARDAGQARSSFHMHLPDFVIMEAILPNDVSGFELCERLKGENENVPVMMLTVINMDDSRSLASRVGVDAYVTKPYDPDELKVTIHQVAEKVWRRRYLGHKDSSSADDIVRFNCTDCGKRLKAKATHRGRSLNCPQCGQTVVVPRYV